MCTQLFWGGVCVSQAFVQPHNTSTPRTCVDLVHKQFLIPRRVLPYTAGAALSLMFKAINLL